MRGSAPASGRIQYSHPPNFNARCPFASVDDLSPSSTPQYFLLFSPPKQRFHLLLLVLILYRPFPFISVHSPPPLTPIAQFETTFGVLEAPLGLCQCLYSFFTLSFSIGFPYFFKIPSPQFAVSPFSPLVVIPVRATLKQPRGYHSPLLQKIRAANNRQSKNGRLIQPLHPTLPSAATLQFVCPRFSQKLARPQTLPIIQACKSASMTEPPVTREQMGV